MNNPVVTCDSILYTMLSFFKIEQILSDYFRNGNRFFVTDLTFSSGSVLADFNVHYYPDRVEPEEVILALEQAAMNGSFTGITGATSSEKSKNKEFKVLICEI